MSEYKNTKKLNKEVIDEILKVENTKGLNAENLLEVAKDKCNPLHDLFSWDDKDAGHQWRLQQARCLINEVKIIVGEKFISAFENVSINVEEGSSRMYKPLNEILNNTDFRNQLVKRALEHAEYWRQQNKMYSELSSIFDAITKTKKRLEKQWQKK